MSWRIRHEGSPRSIDNLTLPQVAAGLEDGLWEPTDEVMGPQDGGWTAIENHAQLAEVALDLEPPPPAHHPDETTLDMNPLIDVCLVLLIFFILTTSYAALQKVLDMPGATPKDVQGIPHVKEKDVEELMIKVVARSRDGQPVITVENKEVSLQDLVAEVTRWARQTKKSILLLDAEGVQWDTVVKITDAATAAKVQKVLTLVRPEDIPPAPKE